MHPFPERWFLTLASEGQLLKATLCFWILLQDKLLCICFSTYSVINIRSNYLLLFIWLLTPMRRGEKSIVMKQ